ncbi:cytoskeletal protein binding protein Sla1 family [Schizosaccharomyces japonicus yFS275]|uniref:Actin cytoskeleton-regulatory complex protein SLA1 n=1 Tax=Schizosaccharomyces japonicus (strain yFS275 / FY16936) TaxID=402676 RepID=B6JVV4_SCHJY|nr:cytoskeletal protein binding protein Sla1 family [Schizosaccharomyces japonicus yFS275]EEB05505.1 cytoskeletal protein binding protein Sla1 family [Schizosaccharomyces japonicus yFS275]
MADLPVIGIYKVLYGYTAQNDGSTGDDDPLNKELSIEEDDLLCLLQKGEDDWFLVKRNVQNQDGQGEIGIVPSNYIEEAQPAASVSALYDYAKQSVDELAFAAGDVLNLYGDLNSDWILAGCKGTYGLVPSNYLDMQAASSGAAAPAERGAVSGQAPSQQPVAPVPTPAPVAAPAPAPVPVQAPIPVPPPPAPAAAPVAAPVAAPAPPLPPAAPAQTMKAPPPPPPAVPPAPSSSSSAAQNLAPPPPPPVPPSAPAAPAAQAQAPMPSLPPRTAAPAVTPASAPVNPTTSVLPPPPPPPQYSAAPKERVSEEQVSSQRAPSSPTDAYGNPNDHFRLHGDDGLSSPTPGEPDMPFKKWDIQEVVGKKKKRSGQLAINNKQIVLTFKKSLDPSQSWSITDLITYSSERKHVFIELHGLGGEIVSLHLHAGSASNAESIIQTLGDAAGTLRAAGLREIAAASGSPLPNLPPDSALDRLNREGETRVRASSSSEIFKTNKSGRGDEDYNPAKGERLATVLYDFEAEESDELSVRAGMRVVIINDTASSDWWKCRYGNKEGVVPSSFLEADKPSAAQAGDTQSHRHESGSSNRKSSSRRHSVLKPDLSKLRTWTDRTGAFKVEAEFIGFSDDKLHLHKANGVKISVPSNKMSLRDLDYIELITGKQVYDRGEANASSSKPAEPLNDDAPPPKPARPRQRSRDEHEELSRFNPKKEPHKVEIVTEQPKPKYDWFDFFLQCGVDFSVCNRYTRNFQNENFDEECIPSLNETTLRTLGLKEGDIIRVMKRVNELRGTPVPTSEPASSESAVPHTEAVVHNVMTGKPQPDIPIGATRRSPTQEMEKGHSVDVNVQQPAPQYTASVNKQVAAAAPEPTKPVQEKFDDDAWAVKPITEPPLRTSSVQSDPMSSVAQGMKSVSLGPSGRELPSGVNAYPERPKSAPVPDEAKNVQAREKPLPSIPEGGQNPVAPQPTGITIQNAYFTVPPSMVADPFQSPLYVQPTGFNPPMNAITAQKTGLTAANMMMHPQVTGAIQQMVAQRTGMPVQMTGVAVQPTGMQPAQIPVQRTGMVVQQTGMPIQRTGVQQPLQMPVQRTGAAAQAYGNTVPPVSMQLQPTGNYAPMQPTGYATENTGLYSQPTGYVAQTPAYQAPTPSVQAQPTGYAVYGQSTPSVGMQDASMMSAPAQNYAPQYAAGVDYNGGAYAAQPTYGYDANAAAGMGVYPDQQQVYDGGYQQMNNYGGYYPDAQQQQQMGYNNYNAPYGQQQQMDYMNPQQSYDYNGAAQMQNYGGYEQNATYLTQASPYDPVNNPSLYMPNGQQNQQMYGDSAPNYGAYASSNQPAAKTGQRANISQATPDNPFGF